MLIGGCGRIVAPGPGCWADCVLAACPVWTRQGGQGASLPNGTGLSLSPECAVTSSHPGVAAKQTGVGAAFRPAVRPAWWLRQAPTQQCATRQ